MKKKSLLLLLAVFLSQQTYAEIQPSASRYDPRNQIVNFNPLNTTVINSAIGYITTVVFDEDEKVIDTQTGYEQGWDVLKGDNRVYIRVLPVKQVVEEMTDNGKVEQKEIALDPESDLTRWKTNLFVVTTKRNYSLELNAKTFNEPKKIAFVVNYRYPDEKRKQQSDIEQQRLVEYQRQQETAKINRELENAKTPKNWQYYQRVAKGSEMLVPDYAYDDGRFTYFAFNPNKKMPSLFAQVGEQETITTPTIEKRGNYTVLVAHQVNDRWVLRLGNQVIGIENKGMGKIRLSNSDTVSENVVKEVTQ
ncbi:TrbG/VirB9 family P-type conjugative transfer protein [Providencia rustigianii]|uniref:P-type conjugative transfer protein VirB9 n=1 Tax=Providencia rustigianii DSM 4541 TaxID=500637 RepID=D1P842_9GAMM|nr:TrbG/VirB9 family P-type conjugative transfer protein [Providencia rustigianii]EFB70485.1 P-type conjugative transfer protein VirB9 [Providencia rustigianii DSM 4541]MBP6436072.1 TrbG/VirB9 family P-type conjugative transfer protein [Paludibacteraceae bacterium]SUD70750.1 Pertussis toxin liberation protein F [Providencia rustigianii]